jgi:hypothetical protein
MAIERKKLTYAFYNKTLVIWEKKTKQNKLESPLEITVFFLL